MFICWRTKWSEIGKDSSVLMLKLIHTVELTCQIPYAAFFNCSFLFICLESDMFLHGWGHKKLVGCQFLQYPEEDIVMLLSLLGIVLISHWCDGLIRNCLFWTMSIPARLYPFPLRKNDLTNLRVFGFLTLQSIWN